MRAHHAIYGDDPVGNPRLMAGIQPAHYLAVALLRGRNIWVSTTVLLYSRREAG